MGAQAIVLDLVLDFISNVEAVLKLSDIIFYQLESDMKNWTSELYDKNSE